MQAVCRDWSREDVLVGGWLKRWLFVRGFGEDVSATIEFLSFVVSIKMLDLDLAVNDVGGVAMLPRLAARTERGRIGIVGRLVFLSRIEPLNR